MENKKEMIKTNKKSPILLIVILVIATVFTLGTIGFMASKVASTDQEEKKPNDIVVSGGEEIKVSDEATLRELLQKEETLTIVVNEDIYTSKTFAINGTKTLKGSGSILMKLDAEAKKDLCSVAKGAHLILDGVTIDGNGVATGIHVNTGAELTCLSGEIVYGMPYGIQATGKVEIEDITINRTMHTGIYVATGGEVYINGGKITNSIEDSIALAKKAYVKISGDTVLDGTSGTHVYNYGKIDITSGKFMNSSQNAFYNYGEVNIVSESDDLVEICNSDKSAIASISGAIINVDGLYIHDMGTYGINTTKGSTGTIKNCVIEKTGKVALNVLDSKVTAEDVKISGGQHRGIVNNNGTATFKNVEVNNMLGAGIITAGKKSETTLEDIVIAKVAKSGLGITGGKVTAKNLEISEAAGSGINITTAAGTTEIANAKVTKSGKNGLAMTIGKLTAKDLMIDGSTGNGVYLKEQAVVNFTDVTIKNSELHAVGNYGGKFTSKNLTIEGTVRGGLVSKGGTVTCEATTIRKTGSRAVNILENCKTTLTDLTVKEAGNTAIYVDGSTFKLTNYEIDQVTGHGMQLQNSENIVVQNGKLSNVTKSGVYVGENAKVTFEDGNIAKIAQQGFAVYRGTAYIRRTTIEEIGRGGIISDGGTVKTNTVAISNTGSRAISIKNNALGGFTNLTIEKANTSINAENWSASIWVEDSEGNFTDFSITNSTHVGVQVKGTSTSSLYRGTIDAQHQGICVSNGAVATAQNVTIERMEGNAQPLINIEADSTFTLKKDSVVDGNGYPGRGVRVAGSFIMNNGTIRNNNYSGEEAGSGDKAGAGVYVAGNFVMNGGTIEDNTSVKNGAGVHIKSGGTFTLNKGTIADNHADEAGAGVSAFGTFNMAGGTVKGNSTDTNAGGILVSKDATFAMSAGTVSGNTAEKSGGGLFIQSENATITGGTIKENTAATDGAGVYVHASGILAMEDGTIQNNTAERNGGGLYIATTVEEAENVIAGGVIEKNTAAYGGGVFVASESVFKLNGENATVENNHSTKSGAGVAVYGTFNLVSGKIQNNTAEANAAGILVNTAGVFSMTDGTVAGNVADGKGGGIYIQSESSDADFTTNIHGGSITGNGAANGAGIYVDTNKNISIKNVTVQGNTATENGGGIYVYRAKSCVMGEGGLIASNTAVNGGGVYMTGSGIFTMEDGSITTNVATGTEDDGETVAGMGAGVYVGSNTNKPFTMTGGTISGHGTEAARSNSQGAGVYVASGSVFNLNGERAVIENNYTSQNGAGVYVTSTAQDDGSYVAGTFTMSAGTIRGNNTTGNGAGVLLKQSTVFTMTGGTITNNTAGKNGGGIFTQSVNTTITGGIIQGNTATGTIKDETLSDGNGGGVYVHLNGFLTMSAGTIKNNTAAGTGGGIYIGTTVDKVTNTITGGVIEENTAANGGGIYLNTSKDVAMSNVTIQNNTATQNGGGVYVEMSKSCNMASGTITANTAVNGGGVYTHNKGAFTMKGGTITNNTATESGAGVCVAANTNKPFTMTGGTISGHGTKDVRSSRTGAGVYVASGSVFNMNGDNAVIENNYTSQNGAGVYVAGATEDKEAGTFTLEKGIIRGNDSAMNGGGVFLETGVAMTMTGGKIINNHCTTNGGAICAEGSNVLTLQAGEISGNSADKTVQGVFMQSAGSTSQVTLYTTFIMGNEIRYNSLSKRGTDNPVLIIKGNSLDYTLNLGFHNTGTVYIQCDSAEAAEQIYSKISQYGTSWKLSYEEGSSYIKAAK